jgi:N-acetylglucosaminyldiphosphoundecaprenol N-acetyl-beta-D-mannosaminyltransferase
MQEFCDLTPQAKNSATQFCDVNIYSTAIDAPTGIKCIQFLGQRFHIASADRLLTLLECAISAPPEVGSIVLHANLHSMFCRARNRSLQAAMSQYATFVLFEGIALKVGRLLTAFEWCPDVSGTDLVPLFLKQRSRQPLRIALVGGRPSISDRAAAFIKKSMPGIDVVAVADGYGDLSAMGPIHELVAESKPDVVLLGLGTPLQEITATAWRTAGTAPLIWCIGGLLDYWAGERVRSPLVFRRLRIEWLWRLVRHPTTFWRRTFIEGPWLLMQILKHWQFGNQQLETLVGDHRRAHDRDIGAQE